MKLKLLILAAEAALAVEGFVSAISQYIGACAVAEQAERFIDEEEDILDAMDDAADAGYVEGVEYYEDLYEDVVAVNDRKMVALCVRLYQPEPQ